MDGEKWESWIIHLTHCPLAPSPGVAQTGQWASRISHLGNPIFPVLPVEAQHHIFPAYLGGLPVWITHHAVGTLALCRWHRELPATWQGRARSLPCLKPLLRSPRVRQKSVAAVNTANSVSGMATSGWVQPPPVQSLWPHGHIGLAQEVPWSLAMAELCIVAALQKTAWD